KFFHVCGNARTRAGSLAILEPLTAWCERPFRCRHKPERSREPLPCRPEYVYGRFGAWYAVLSPVVIELRIQLTVGHQRYNSVHQAKLSFVCAAVLRAVIDVYVQIRLAGSKRTGKPDRLATVVVGQVIPAVHHLESSCEMRAQRHRCPQPEVVVRYRQ